MTSTKFTSLALLLVIFVILQGVKEGESNPHDGGQFAFGSPGAHYPAQGQGFPSRPMGFRERIRNRIRNRLSGFRGLFGWSDYNVTYSHLAFYQDLPGRNMLRCIFGWNDSNFTYSHLAFYQDLPVIINSRNYQTLF